MSALEFSRLIWVDYCGLVRTKVYPRNSLDTDPKVTKVGMSQTLDGDYPSTCTENSTGEVGLLSPNDNVPLPIIRQYTIPWNPRHFFIFASMHHLNGELWMHCPRGILQRAIDLLSTHSLKAQAGYELEFALLDPKNNYQPWPFADDMLYCSAQAYDIAAPVLDDIHDTLHAMGIYVRMLHAENGPGQFEVVLQHTDVMQAVEHSVLAKEAVRAVARKHGKHATFAPVYGSAMGSGGHVHVSLCDHFSTEDRIAMNGTLVSGIDGTAQSFIQGIVDGLQWIMFPLNASPMSYRRVKPAHWVGAYQAWGVNNKEAPVRLADDGSNVEVKVGDGISNPFLGLAAILTAGALGVKNKVPLSAPCQVDPGADFGIKYKRLPVCLKDAISQFERTVKLDKDVANVFPPAVAHDFVAVRSQELNKPEEVLLERIKRLF